MPTVIRHNADGTHTEKPVKNLEWLRSHAGEVHHIVITRDPSGGGAKMRAVLADRDYLTNWEDFYLAVEFVHRAAFDGCALYVLNDGVTRAEPIDFYGQGYLMAGTDVRTNDPGGRSMTLRAACKPPTMPAA